MEGLPTTEQIDFQIQENVKVLQEKLGVKCKSSGLAIRFTRLYRYVMPHTPWSRQLSPKC